MKKLVWRPLICLGIVVFLVSCSSTGRSSDAWTRSYIASREMVIEIVVQVLEDEDYLVETDRDKGRIDARPSSTKRSAGAQNLAIRMSDKSGIVQVSVEILGSFTEGSLTGTRAETPVLEFLNQLDSRMRESR